MKHNSKTSLKGIALLALGTAAVLLFTTEKGKDIRKSAKSKAEGWGEDFSDWREEAGDKFASLKTKYLKEAESLADEMRSRFEETLDEGKARGKKLYNRGKEHLS